MAVLPDEVRPGELISSEWINDLRRKLAELDAQVQQLAGSVGTGTATVPNVFGRTLSQARQNLGLPAVQLALGIVVDASGVFINPNTVASAGLIVIGQLPVPGARVTPGTAVNLVVAASVGGGPPTTPAPTITGFRRNGQPVSSTPAGELVEITGTNFASSFAGNLITFNGEPAAALGGNFLSLLVRVPEDLPGTPNGAGTLPVTVRVQRQTDGAAGTAQHNITAPLEGPPRPVINPGNPVDPGFPVVGEEVAINGQNFSTTPAQNIIHFDQVEVAAATATEARLTVIVPTNIPGLLTSGATKFVSLSVEREIGQESNNPQSDPVFVEMQRA